MMNKKGQLDQIITSIIIVVAAVFISGVFVVISSNIAQISGVGYKSSDAPVYANNGVSKAMLDVFLADEVLVKGKTMKVSEAVNRFSGADGLDYAVAVENLFKERYSCNGANALGISKHKSFAKSDSKTDSSSSGVNINRYIDYPSRNVNSDNFGIVQTVYDGSSASIYPVSFGKFNGASFELSDITVEVLAQEVTCVR